MFCWSGRFMALPTAADAIEHYRIAKCETEGREPRNKKVNGEAEEEVAEYRRSANCWGGKGDEAALRADFGAGAQRVEVTASDAPANRAGPSVAPQLAPAQPRRSEKLAPTTFCPSRTFCEARIATRPALRHSALSPPLTLCPLDSAVWPPAMSSGKELETPHTLASLPKPIDPVNGRTLASTVYSLSAARKRKRSELAVSVDGDGISLFDVCLARS